ncbi:DUF4192 family protein [Agromyces sp. NPDC058484]|uniref:DUF4192 family protein n=1 Tax=Agromyces sp. NPDC058484 TaxID=3346524 RepID=UPI003650A09E
MTTIIRAGAAHDLLALVPALAGFRPERSIVCVAFRGNRSAGVLRYDLPRRARDRPFVADTLIGTLCRMPGVDAVVPIAYTEATFAARRGLPERALLSLVVRRAEQAGFVVRDALCRAADAWGSLLDPETPASGHPLAMIEGSAAADRAPVAASGLGSPASGGALPQPDERRAAAIAAELDALADDAQVEARLERLGAEADPVELVEALLRDDPGSHPVERLAWFLHLAGSPPMRDAMMLQLAFGPVVGMIAHDDADATAARAARCGETVDRLVRREFDSGEEDDVSEMLGRLLLGQSTTRPDPRRVDRALDVLRPLAADAPAGWRAAPLCMAAWLAWSLGRGSAAGALIDRALDVEPDHAMASLLAAFIGSGALPAWAFADPGRPGAQ